MQVFVCCLATKTMLDNLQYKWVEWVEVTVRDGIDCYANRLQIGYNTQTEHAAFALWTHAVLSCHFGLT